MPRGSIYPFGEMQVGESRTIELELPSGLVGWTATSAAVMELCGRFNAAMRQYHRRHPGRFSYTVTHGPRGPIIHLQRNL